MGCLDEPECYLGTILGVYTPCVLLMIVVLILFEINYHKNKDDDENDSTSIIIARMAIIILTIYQTTSIIRAIIFAAMDLKGSVLMDLLFVFPAIMVGAGKALTYYYIILCNQTLYTKLPTNKNLVNPFCCCCRIPNGEIWNGNNDDHDHDNNSYNSYFTINSMTFATVYFLMRLSASWNLWYQGTAATGLTGILAALGDIIWLIFLSVFVFQRYNEMKKTSGNGGNDNDNIINDKIKRATITTGIYICVGLLMSIAAMGLGSNGYNGHLPNNFGYWSVDYTALISNTVAVYCMGSNFVDKLYCCQSKYQD